MHVGGPRPVLDSQEWVTTQNPYGFELGDVNGDGHLDLWLAADPTSIRLGDGVSFSDGQELYHWGADDTRLVDVDGDGDLDALSVDDFRDKLLVSRNNGHGNFGTPAEYTVANAAQIAPGDFDGDGDTDIVIRQNQYGPGELLLYVNDGLGGFSPGAPVGASAAEVLVTDLDGDGYPDLVSLSGPTISTHFADGDGTFVAGPSFAPAGSQDVRGLDVGDVDADGDVDIVSNGRIGFDGFRWTVLNNGDRTFGAPLQGSAPWLAEQLTLGDVNNDGRVDILFDGAGVYVGDGSGGFVSSMTVSGGAGGDHVTLLDVSGDGVLDLLHSSLRAGRFGVQRGFCDGTFERPEGAPLPAQAWAQALADFDGDGDLDSAVGLRDSDLSVVLSNDGAGDFSVGSPFAMVHDWGVMVSGDLNGDGRADLLSGGSSGVHAMLGAADGSFSTGPVHSTGARPITLELADVNDDGHLDLLAAHYNTGLLTVSLGVGDGDFLTPVTSLPIANGGADAARFADLDVDGHLDVVALLGNGLRVYWGDGAGGFAASSDFAITTYADGESLVVGDFNADGLPDVAVSTVWVNADLFIHFGEGARALSDATRLDIQADWVDSMLAFDVSGDGVDDLVVSNVNGVGFSVYVSDGVGGFYPPVGYWNRTWGLAQGDADGDGIDDVWFLLNHDSLGVLLQ